MSPVRKVPSRRPARDHLGPTRTTATLTAYARRAATPARPWIMMAAVALSAVVGAGCSGRHDQTPTQPLQVAVPAQLAVTAEPAGAVPGAAFKAQPVVEIRDSTGAKVTGAANSITVAIVNGNGALSGITTVTAANGVATFTDLAIDKAGTFTLSFTSSGLANATTMSFSVRTPQTTQAVAVAAVHTWYQVSTSVDPWVMLNVTGDLMTMNFNNFGARANNVEPRVPYDNDAASGDAEAAAKPWAGEYATLDQADPVLRDIEAGVELPGGTAKYRALALWAQAGALMQNALIFDQGLAIDEHSDSAAASTLVPYARMEALAMSKLDTLIALTSAQDFTYSQTEFPMVGGLTSQKLNRIANTMAAQLLAYSPRSAAQAATVDWAKVLQYVTRGIGTGTADAPFDLTVTTDFNNWYSQLDSYFDSPSWMPVDLHLIHQMAPNVPDAYVGTPTGCTVGDDACYDRTYAPISPHDARLGIDYTNTSTTLDSAGTDFYYARQVLGDPSRGIYMQSPYYYGRYIGETDQVGNPVGPAPYTLAAESDLVQAEALIRTGGDRTLAAQLVNNTRAARGHLTPLTASDNDATFLNAITYEREVECNSTDGFGFFALRHVDQVQDGTVRELPVPAAVLTSLGQTIYTFGGAGTPGM